MKKLLSVLALCVLISLGMVEASSATESPPDPVAVECVGQIIGEGVATSNGHCALVAYRYADGAPGPDQLATSLPQTLVDSDASDSAGTLDVTVPDCFWQIDLVDADAVIASPLNQSDYYSSNGWLVDAWHGGTDECAPPPTTTTTVTVPETSTTVTVPQETTTVPSIVTTAPPAPEPPTNELARTGLADYHNYFTVVFGMALAAIGLLVLEGSLRKQHDA